MLYDVRTYMRLNVDGNVAYMLFCAGVCDVFVDAVLNISR